MEESRYIRGFFSVFPAGAGVILSIQEAINDIDGVPCGCRGDPWGTSLGSVFCKCSLRVQG